MRYMIAVHGVIMFEKDSNYYTSPYYEDNIIACIFSNTFDCEGYIVTYNNYNNSNGANNMVVIIASSFIT